MKSNGFIAVITPSFLQEKHHIMECKQAEKLNLPMYAVITKGTTIGEYENFSWRKKYYFKTEQDINNIMLEIKRDLQWFKGLGGT